MTVTTTPEFVQSLIVRSNARKEMMAAAMDTARKSLQATAHIPWQPYAAGQHANARAERVAWVIDAL